MTKALEPIVDAILIASDVAVSGALTSLDVRGNDLGVGGARVLRDAVKAKTEDFIRKTGVDEVIVASHIYYQEDRLKSLKIFSEIMTEINQGTLH